MWWRALVGVAPWPWGSTLRTTYSRARRTTLPAPSLLRPRLAPLPICQCELPAQDTKSGAGSASRLLATSSRPTCLTCSSRPAAETEQDRIASAAVPIAEHFALVMGRKPNHSCEELASQRTAEAQNADKERLMDQKLERMNALAHIAARIVSSPNSTSGNVPRAPKRQGAGQQNMLYLRSTLDAATYVH